MAISRLSRLLARLADPFGFEDALRGLALQPEDLPSLTRECRLAGVGV